MDVQPLSPAEAEVWRTLSRVMVVLPRAVAGDLERETGLSHSAYFVLMHLSESPDRRLRMSDLAGRSELSPSRMTRLVAGLESDGLVRRCASSDDGRAWVAHLTDAGLDRLREAWPGHLAGVRRLVFDQLTADELGPLADVLHRLLDAAAERGEGCSLPEAPEG